MTTGFVGEFNHSLDAKGRLILPSRFRGEFEGKCFISKGYDKTLSIYTVEEWTKFIEKLATLSVHNAAARQIRRFFASSAAECDMDKQGRIVIPPNLRSFLELPEDSTDVVVVGAIEKIDVWSAENWKKYTEDIVIEEAGEKLAELGL
ncbi:MAG: division/cell wall cluster transcriptional repressor MraZ [Clostridia bacterium]|nr:division/cell wall cluster transcriptional repressor MraZ [Clostridia bacterium]MBQ9598361.1 division/cell wall cluster transcriptional repressor MraZ [Clostridia bacterium]